MFTRLRFRTVCCLRREGRGTAGHSHRVLPVGLPSIRQPPCRRNGGTLASHREAGSTGAVERIFLGIARPCNTTTTATTISS